MIMSHRRCSLVLGILLALAAPLWCAAKKKEPPPPELDPNRIINESYGFLKDREPEMTETEYALYEKVIPMISAQPEFALKLLEGMVGEADSSAAFEFVLGNVYFEQKRYDDAETHFKAATTKFATFVRAWDNLGVLYFTTERYAEAVPCFTKAIILGEAEPRLFGLLGYCLLKSDNPLAAEAAYLQAFALDPKNSDWIEGLLNTYLGSQQYARAETLLRQLVRLKPKESRFWLLLGNVLLTQEHKLDAIATLEAALSLQVLPSEGMMMLGDLYAEQKLYADAVRTYQALTAKDAELGVERMVRFATALTGTADYDRAGQVLDAAAKVATGEQQVPVLQARAGIHLAREEWTEAQPLLEDIVSRDPLNGRALLDLGRTEEKLGHDSQAIFNFENAARIPENTYSACLYLANLEVRLQHFDEAIAYIDKALAVDKTSALQEFRARVTAMQTKPK